VSEPALVGWHHLSFTVSSTERSVPWYVDVLGFEILGDFDHDGGRTVVLAQNEVGFRLLLQERKAHEGSTFSEFRPGLDHLSFRVPDRANLDAWVARLDELGVEHEPIDDEEYGSVLILRDPDRIQLELFVDRRRPGHETTRPAT
jgi:catechol 2,3-dioxygenase-like lactoylglutathione lyase family enzyme